MSGILSVGEFQALTVQMGTPPLQRAEMIHTSRYLYNICNFSKCQLEYIKNTKVFFCTSRKVRRGTGRREWEREMKEGEGDEEMKKVSVWMHSSLLCTDSCTQGHTRKHKQMHTHTLWHPSPWPHWPPLLATFALGLFLIVGYSRALLSQLSAHLGFKPELLTPP